MSLFREAYLLSVRALVLRGNETFYRSVFKIVMAPLVSHHNLLLSIILVAIELELAVG